MYAIRSRQSGAIWAYLANFECVEDAEEYAEEHVDGYDPDEDWIGEV